MVQPGHESLSVRSQCELLSLSRSGLYYQPEEVSQEELQLMRRIDALYLERPYYGSRRMTVALGAEGHEVNRKRVQRLMRIMGLEGMAPGPHTSRPHPEHPVYPYLLHGLAVERADQVWASDITYLPLAHGWAYLVAIMDWNSRAVLAWRLSNTLCADFCIEALEEALRHHGPRASSTPTRARSSPTGRSSAHRGARPPPGGTTWHEALRPRAPGPSRPPGSPADPTRVPPAQSLQTSVVSPRQLLYVRQDVPSCVE